MSLLLTDFCKWLSACSTKCTGFKFQFCYTRVTSSGRVFVFLFLFFFLTSQCLASITGKMGIIILAFQEYKDTSICCRKGTWDARDSIHICLRHYHTGPRSPQLAPRGLRAYRLGPKEKRTLGRTNPPLFFFSF